MLHQWVHSSHAYKPNWNKLQTHQTRCGKRMTRWYDWTIWALESFIFELDPLAWVMSSNKICEMARCVKSPRKWEQVKRKKGQRLTWSTTKHQIWKLSKNMHQIWRNKLIENPEESKDRKYSRIATKNEFKKAKNPKVMNTAKFAQNKDETSIL